MALKYKAFKAESSISLDNSIEILVLPIALNAYNTIFFCSSSNFYLM